jgi:hypothetical protein
MKGLKKDWKVGFYGPWTMDHGLKSHIVNAARRAKQVSHLTLPLGGKH